MVNIAFDKYDFRTRLNGNRQEIWEPVRQQWLALTPEEWVRQHWLHWLMAQSVPRARMAVETTIKVNKMVRRADIVIFNPSFQPHIIIECKSESVLITQDVFDQVARYNLALRVPFLVISNGKLTLACAIHHKSETWEPLDIFPPLT